MGCFCSKKKQGQPSLPAKQPAPPAEPQRRAMPTPQPPPAPAKPTATFSIRIGTDEVIAVLTSTGLVITVSDRLQTADDIRAAESDQRLCQDDFFYRLASAPVVFVKSDTTLDKTFKFANTVLSPGVCVKLGGKDLEVLQDNRQHIVYTEDSSIKPGTPVIFGEQVVGLHERSGRAISINWICAELGKDSFNIKEPLNRFLSIVQGKVMELNPMSHIYSVSSGVLLSFDPDSCKFFNHSSGLPESPKMCYVPNGVLIAGGVEGRAPSSRVSMFDAVSGLLLSRAALKKSRHRHCLCYLKGFVYCISGETVEGPTPSCEKYQMQKDTWDTVPSLPALPAPRVDAGVTAFNGVVYVIGGLGATDVLQLSEKGWESLPTHLPVFGAPLFAESDKQFIYLYSQHLLRWNPSSDPQEVLNAPFSAPVDTARLAAFSFYVFSEKDVYEVKLDKMPAAWVTHKNALPNFA